MTEQILKDYLNGFSSVETLSRDIADTVSHSRDISYYKITDIKSVDQFIVTTKHLFKICFDVIDLNIKLEDLEVIAFTLESSDYFTWDTKTKDGNKVEDVISNWSTRESNKAATMEYVKYCAFYLKTGDHR
jgi:hypothetical protein